MKFASGTGFMVAGAASIVCILAKPKLDIPTARALSPASEALIQQMPSGFCDRHGDLVAMAPKKTVFASSSVNRSLRATSNRLAKRLGVQRLWLIAISPIALGTLLRSVRLQVAVRG